MAWSILDEREKRNGWIVLAVVIASALSASIMVASIMPFLTVLSDPSRIHEVVVFDWVYQKGGFSDPKTFLYALGAASIVMILLANMIQIIRTYVVNRYAMMRIHTISARILSCYLRQPYSFFLANHSGEMGTQILSESQQVVMQFFRPAADGFAAFATITALLCLLLIVEPTVTLAVFGIFGSIYGCTVIVTRRSVERLGKSRAAANSNRFRLANEALGGARDIKLLGREFSYLDRYREPSQKMAQSLVKVAVIKQIPQYVMQATAFSGLIVLCLALLAQEPLGDTDTTLTKILPTIGFLAFAGQRLLPEMSRLFQSLTDLKFADAAVQTVYYALIIERQAVKLPRRPAQPLTLENDIVFENVGFRYEGHGKPGLSDVSFRIRAGERVGVVGTTGAGKSTLASILLGLLSPSEGRFLVDDIEITPERTRAWQRNLGYVPQEIFLIDSTVRENIALGVPPNLIDDIRVEKAARTARVHDFITQELDNAYLTKVGERGVRLSGGQRQRIGLARALYNDGTLIVLDEATSALDNMTETEVMRSIQDLSGEKTLIMIAHRLSTLRSCDRILVLDKGKVSGFASWEELEFRNPVFRGLAADTRDSKPT